MSCTQAPFLVLEPTFQFQKETEQNTQMANILGSFCLVCLKATQTVLFSISHATFQGPLLGSRLGSFEVLSSLLGLSGLGTQLLTWAHLNCHQIKKKEISFTLCFFFSSEWPDRMEWMNTEETGVSTNKFKVTDVLLRSP